MSVKPSQMTAALLASDITPQDREALLALKAEEEREEAAAAAAAFMLKWKEETKKEATNAKLAQAKKEGS